MALFEYKPFWLSIGRDFFQATSIEYTFLFFQARIICPSSLIQFILPSSSHHTTTAFVLIAFASLAAASV